MPLRKIKEKPKNWIIKDTKNIWKSNIGDPYEMFGGSEKAKPHSTKEGRVASGKRRMGRVRKRFREEMEKAAPLEKRPERVLKPYRAKKSVGGSIIKILKKLGKEIKKQPLPKKTKDLDKKFKKAFPHHDSAGKLKKAGGGRAIYKSGGAVLKGKKVGIQIK